MTQFLSLTRKFELTFVQTLKSNFCVLGQTILSNNFKQKVPLKLQRVDISQSNLETWISTFLEVISFNHHNQSTVAAFAWNKSCPCFKFMFRLQLFLLQGVGGLGFLNTFSWGFKNFPPFSFTHPIFDYRFTLSLVLEKPCQKQLASSEQTWELPQSFGVKRVLSMGLSWSGLLRIFLGFIPDAIFHVAVMSFYFQWSRRFGVCESFFSFLACDVTRHSAAEIHIYIYIYIRI